MNQNQLITMTQKEVNRYEIIKELLSKKIDGAEAAKLLSRSVRQIKRIKAVVKCLGIKGIIHGNRGKVSHNKTCPVILAKAKKYLHKDYHDFNPLLAQEKLFEINKVKLSKETVRKLMISEQLWKPRKKGITKKHFWRERKDNYGEMQQFDGSYHNWFEGRNEKELGLEQCLLLSVDDATGKLTGAIFESNESVGAVFRFWKEYFVANGLPISIYLDKFSTYKVNHKNAVDNKELMTQFQRAMNQLGVRVISANSPQANGRVEKMNNTLQRRLVKELRLSNINTIADASKFLKEIFIPKFSKQFAVLPKKKSDLHQILDAEKMKELDKILSVQSERKINNDYTIRFKGNYYQLEETQPTTVYKKEKITIEEHLSGEIKISLRNHCLNYFCLPERPKKEMDIKLAALTSRKQASWTPPANHPWRKQFLINKKQPILSAVER
ncbi:ISNCY family transposase [Patescibacteria group bacterium]|nr:ISNCY family transposase [Patescibacteria group bacterium]